MIFNGLHMISLTFYRLAQFVENSGVLKKSSLSYVLFLSVIAILIGCDANQAKEEPPDEIPVSSVEPRNLNFGDQETTKSITISNIGEGVLTWEIGGTADWIKTAESGNTRAGEIEEVTVTVDRRGLLPGELEETVYVKSNGGDKIVTVSLSVLDSPTLSVNPSSLDFGYHHWELPITISNSNTSILEWQIDFSHNWLSVIPDHGTTHTELDYVMLSVDRKKLTPGSYNGEIAIHSNGGDHSLGILLEKAGPAEFGIFSESIAGTRLDIDSSIGAFSGMGAEILELEEDLLEKKEGTLSFRTTLRVDASKDEFAGWFVIWGDSTQTNDNTLTKDLSFFAEGQIAFWVKSAINLEIGIRSGDIFAGEEESKILLSNISPFQPDDTWYEVSVPIEALLGRPPAADLERMKVLFVVSSNTNTNGTRGVASTFWIDNIRWVNNP